MKRDKLMLAAALATVTTLLGAALVLGQQQDGAVGAQAQTAVSAVVSPLLQYQARLSDPATGEPVTDGTYAIAFRLYAAPSGGQPLWSEVKDVPVQNGLLSVLLGDTTALDQGLFNGRALWLGIKVGADEETVPRQQMLPAPYALSLVPGAEIQANNSTAALSLSNGGGGPALAAAGPVAVDGDLNVSGSLVGGAHKHSNYVDWYSFDDHVYGGMHHERYTNAEAVSAIKAADGSGSGLDADLLDGQQASAFAAANHHHALLAIYNSPYTVVKDVAPVAPFSNGVRAAARCEDGDIALNGFVSSSAFLIDTYNSAPNPFQPEEWSMILYNVGPVTTDVYVGAVCADMTP